MVATKVSLTKIKCKEWLLIFTVWYKNTVRGYGIFVKQIKPNVNAYLQKRDWRKINQNNKIEGFNQRREIKEIYPNPSLVKVLIKIVK